MQYNVDNETNINEMKTKILARLEFVFIVSGLLHNII